MNSLRHLLSAALSVLLAGGAVAAIAPGTPAPGFTLNDVHGKSLSLSDFQGKVVVLEWTNKDCPFVKKHYASRNLQSLQSNYVGQGIVWLSVCSSAPGKQGHYSPSDWLSILADNGSQASHLLLDPDGTVGMAYGAKTTPHVFVVDSNGNLAYNGAVDDRPSVDPSDIPGARSFICEALDALLAGKPVPIAQTPPYGCSVKY